MVVGVTFAVGVACSYTNVAITPWHCLYISMDGLLRDINSSSCTIRVTLFDSIDLWPILSGVKNILLALSIFV